MDNNGIDVKKIIRAMPLAQKLLMLSGQGMWHLKGTDQLPSVRVSDGPTGLRMAGGTEMTEALPATCFPTPSALACSWDRHLIAGIGELVADEATAMGIHVVLAPGVNIKRNPLCGRNFEYYSEDPFLSGEMGKAYVNGVQLKEVGTSLKHFACNNQETLRQVSDSLVDERALREIYLAAFERVVKQASPTTVMCSYNKLNGEYCSQSHRLLTEILRDEWGYDGVVFSDWGAVHDRVAALRAGLDVEMPGSEGYFDTDLERALERGDIDEKLIDQSLERIITLIDKVYLEPYGDINWDAHDEFAYKAACASAVLLKNENNILPLKPDMRVVIMGANAVRNKIQGYGSSRVTPRRVISPIEAFSLRNISIDYYRGHSKDNNDAALAEALKGAAGADAVVIFAARDFEAECIDVEDMRLPEEQEKLINAVIAAGHKVIVVLATGSAVLMPWADKACAVIQTGLSGQCAGLAAADILYGRVSPQGRLAESYPYKYEDIANAEYYRLDGKQVRYRESIYVGYRYFEKAKTDVRYPFGYGLSYGNVEYTDTIIKKTGEFDFSVNVTVKNTGEYAAHEVIQCYVQDNTNTVYRPVKELKGFEKVYVEPGKSCTVTIPLDFRSFAYYDEQEQKWQTGKGEYLIHIGASVCDIRITRSVNIDGNGKKRGAPGWYFEPVGAASADDFDIIYNKPVRPVTEYTKGHYTDWCTLRDIKRTFIGKMMLKSLKKRIQNYSDPADKLIMINSSLDTPLHSLASLSEGVMTRPLLTALLDLANGHPLRAIKGFVRGNRKKKKNKEIT